MESDHVAVLERSLAAIEREVPVCLQALRAALGVLAVGFDVDGETASLAVDRQRVQLRVSRSCSAVDVMLRCSRAAVVDLVEARLSLLSAAMSERVQIVGKPELLASFDRAWMAYLAGAARSPSFPRILDDFLAVDLRLLQS